MTWGVVVPTCRPEQYAEFTKAWLPLFEKHDAHLFPVHDQPPWTGIPEFIPRRTDMIRSWGFYQAWEAGCDPILTLDDDVRPVAGVDILDEYDKVFDWGAVLSEYFDVGALTTSGLQMRGFPKADRERVEVAIQYGGWNGVLDYDAETQIEHGVGSKQFSRVVVPVPRYAAVTGSAMNMAFRREYTPIVWQLPLFCGRYNRWGDIWAGLLSKVTCDTIGKAVVINGKAAVWHERASDPYVNLEKERDGLRPNERIWDWLNTRFEPDSNDPIDVYEEAAIALCRMFYLSPGTTRGSDAGDEDYGNHLRMALDEWLSLFRSLSLPDTPKTSAGSTASTAGSR